MSLSVSNIRENSEFKSIKKTLESNCRGKYGFQVISYGLVSLKEKLGQKAVAVMIVDVPNIKKIIIVPDDVEQLIQELKDNGEV